MKNYKDIAIENIRSQVKDKKVICGISGGVDSSVTAALIAKAIGKNLTGVFVDTGLLRKDEAQQVKEMFANHFDINFIFVDAKEKFLNALDKVSDPESVKLLVSYLLIYLKKKQKKLKM